MKVLCLFLLGVSCCVAQLAPNATRPETSEFENFSFVYEHTTQTVLVHTAINNCYIWSLTQDELANVHTDDGLKQVEMRVIKEIDDAFFTVIPENIVNMYIVRACRTAAHSHMHYYLVH